MWRTRVFALSIVFVLCFCEITFAVTNEFIIKQYEENREVVFESIDVLPGSIEEQVIVLKSNTGIQNYSGVVGYLTEDESPNDYKRSLPHQRYINPGVHIVYEIAWSKSNAQIILVRRIMNFSPDNIQIDGKTVLVDWYLVKNKKIKTCL